MSRPYIPVHQRLNNPADRSIAWRFAGLLLCVEAIGCAVILQRISCKLYGSTAQSKSSRRHRLFQRCAIAADTEIDWIAYMQQVQQFAKGERDYSQIKGQTGPLVYPAGFLYIYTLLAKLTQGGNIILGQMIFTILYLLNQALVMSLYIQSQAVPPWALTLLCLSKRIHSIFILRMFNDSITMMLAYTACLLLVNSKWRWAVFVFSAALSVKMNVLLMAPPVLVIVLQAAKWNDLLKGVAAAVCLQLVLGLPFLLQYPAEYVSKSFEMSRIFLLEWSVNWSFLAEDFFKSKGFARFLLAAHASLLLLFAHFKWCKRDGGLPSLITRRLRGNRLNVAVAQASKGSDARTARHVLLVVFTGNFIGIVCARTLHFQFYSWYFHTIPFLLWQVKASTPLRLIMFACIEVMWNVFPTRGLSSAILLFCHLLLLIQLWLASDWVSNQTAKVE